MWDFTNDKTEPDPLQVNPLGESNGNMIYSLKPNRLLVGGLEYVLFFHILGME